MTALLEGGTDAGADPGHLSDQGRRALLGFTPESDESLLDVSPEEFLRARTRRFGNGNPEFMREPFWEAMIRSGVTGAQATMKFKGSASGTNSPVWCAQRFGQSITFLPDGRNVLIGGEHEDHYDADFCIYNDVFVHHPGCSIQVLGYPEEIFPPTDFHTATLVDGQIYVIGSLGYLGHRHHADTPVYRLDTQGLQIERVATSGPAPGWISGHRATLISDHEIQISGGNILTKAFEQETSPPNPDFFVFDIRLSEWRAVVPVP